MAYVGEDRVLLFGGIDSLPLGNNNETWFYDLSDHAWTQKFPATSPSARHNHGLAYIGGDQVLLFGGFSGGAETWVYDLSDNTWTQKFPPTPPLARDGTQSCLTLEEIRFCSMVEH
ncbi:kelch repeat-containing protein [bacterium]|nr:kelch repeat-containing protein [bacterium]